MVMYNREEAPPELKLRFHIRDRFGKDILNSIRYDPDTGQGFRKDIRGGYWNGKNEIEYFSPKGYVEIDGHVNPLPEELVAIYASVKAHLSPEVMDSISKKVIEDARRQQGKEPEAAS